jgi:hypothetical protein
VVRARNRIDQGYAKETRHKVRVDDHFSCSQPQKNVCVRAFLPRFKGEENFRKQSYTRHVRDADFSRDADCKFHGDNERKQSCILPYQYQTRKESKYLNNVLMFELHQNLHLVEQSMETSRNWTVQENNLKHIRIFTFGSFQGELLFVDNFDGEFLTRFFVNTQSHSGECAAAKFVSDG